MIQRLCSGRDVWPRVPGLNVEVGNTGLWNKKGAVQDLGRNYFQDETEMEDQAPLYHGVLVPSSIDPNRSRYWTQDKNRHKEPE